MTDQLIAELKRHYVNSITDPRSNYDRCGLWKESGVAVRVDADVLAVVTFVRLKDAGL